jgi:spermidine synthase
LLTSVLALLAAGAWLSSMLLRRHGRDTLRLFAWAALSAVAGIAVSSALVHIWIFNHAGIEKNLPGVQSLLIFYRIGAALVLMAPALVPLGMLFPMALTASRQAENRTGREAGFFYLVNTAGSVTGSLGVGFFLILFSGSYGSLKILAGITGVLAVVLFVLLFRRLKFQAAAGMLTVLLLLGLFPLPARLVYFQAPGDLLYWHEDEQGIFQIVKAKADGTLIVTNDATALVFHAGKYMTSFVQQMQGHLGVMFRPHARNVAVIGSGYGITAGAMTRYSGLTNIDAVEIIPSMIATAGYYGPWNFNYYKDSRVHLHIDDGRHFLARAKKPYDIISVNVTDPELPGAAALFHHEFYEMVKRKLTPDGILVQHVFGYQTARALATMSKTFPCILLYRSYANGFNVVAAQRPLHFSPLDVQALLAQDKVKKALYDIGFIDPLNMKDYLSDGLPYEAVFDEYDRNMLMATDDHPRIEFSWNPDQFQFFFSNQ